MTMLSRVVPPIAPLSADDIAQITSSVVITRLEDVLIELIKNSLDAKAARIDASFDISKGSCTVEDDGEGISTQEFGRDGGLARRYWTSKTKQNGLFGRNGTFLSSVAALSRLAITSRQMSQVSLNSAVFRPSKPPIRHSPGFYGENIFNGKHGTLVSVRNLFGNMPVRLKQRALYKEFDERRTAWRNVQREIVALLLVWAKPINLTLRDEGTGLMLAIRQNNAAKKYRRTGTHCSTSPVFDLETVLSILTQGSFILADSWPSWVPIAACTSALSIKGAVSLNPAPNRRCQFILLGVEPLSCQHSDSQLHDEINSYFVNSTFGKLEENAGVDEERKESQKGDPHFRLNEATRKEFKAGRKAVDRWPMFYLRIELKEYEKSRRELESFHGDPAFTKAVLEMLYSMFNRWLQENGFVPQKLKRKRMREHSVVDLRAGENSVPSYREDLSSSEKFVSQSVSSMSEQERNTRKGPKWSAFGNWSNIKSGKNTFFDDALPVKLIDSISTLSTGRTDDQLFASYRNGAQNQICTNSCDVVAFQEDIVSTGLKSAHVTDPAVLPPAEVQPDSKMSGEQIMKWVHPVTKKVFCVSNLSGVTLPQPSPISLSSLRPISASLEGQGEHATIPKELKEDIAKKSLYGSERSYSIDWLQNVLGRWSNPIFLNTELVIRQATIQDNCGCSDDTGQSRPKEFSFDSNESLKIKLSAAGLESARVIAQVDDKFILVVMTVSRTDKMTSGTRGTSLDTVLVVIDQHAADERCRIEALFQELCQNDTATLIAAWASNLGKRSDVATLKLHEPIVFQVPSNETTMFANHAGFFARWGILYDLKAVTGFDSSHGCGPTTITIRTLPPCISERCVADPKLILTLLRTESSERENHSQNHQEIQGVLLNNSQESESISTEDRHSWLRKISGCPQKLIEMLNSRACRSAIMFNDRLEIKECQELVARLSQCAFPFQCAHGRPSLVPLIDLGATCMSYDVACGEGNALNMGDTIYALRKNSETGVETCSFAQAYRMWRRGWTVPHSRCG